jgi:multicomponent Na+:H+ antiporter subunit G
MSELITSILLVAGATFALLAAIGITRMPDLFTRMHATTKSGTLGIGTIAMGAAIYFNQLGITTRLFLVVVFLLLTIPVAAQMIARAAYFTDTPRWKGTVRDEMCEHCDTEKHEVGHGDI